ncbi:Type II secretion system protein F [bioreactor metagenome]|uniref:Type II secretion system protein F n=1 Tax=bioreactor metagenome TaxID=1076179 RepID=A0A644WL28_9ZZZZ
MPEFIFKARSLAGEAWSGTLEADSAEALEFMLNDKGFFPLEIKPKPEGVSLARMFGKVNKRDLAVFSRQLSVIISSGVTIIEAIAILAEQTEKQSFKEVLEVVGDDVQKGKLLSQSMSAFPGVFPEFLRNMIRVGEASGTLDDIMEQMANYYENEDKINRKVKSAMTYPMILGIMTVGVVILLMVMVLPMFSSILSEMGGQMPMITVVLMAISNFMRLNIGFIALGVAAVVFAFTSYTRTPSGRLRFDAFKVSFPLTRGLTVKVITSRFARSMGILLKSGINIINAMNIMTTLIGNRAVEEKFAVSSEEVQQGRGIAESLSRIGIFPPLLIHMIQVGEKTGELDQMLLRTSGFFDDEVETAVTKMTTLIEPVMIVILAVIVAVILLSIFLPMLSIMNAVS